MALDFYCTANTSLINLYVFLIVLHSWMLSLETSVFGSLLSTCSMVDMTTKMSIHIWKNLFTRCDNNISDHFSRGLQCRNWYTVRRWNRRSKQQRYLVTTILFGAFTQYFKWINGGKCFTKMDVQETKLPEATWSFSYGRYLCEKRVFVPRCGLFWYWIRPQGRSIICQK